MGYSDNINQVDAAYARMEREYTGGETLEIRNNMEYARPLHNKHGYYVFAKDPAKRIVRQTLRQVAKRRPLSPKNVQRALDASGFELVGFYRSLTPKIRPPVKAGEGFRRAHPGNWADITGNLANAYQHRVNRGAFK